MKNVEIINKEDLINLYKNHGLFACTCYDTPDKYAEKVGKSCNDSGHMSGSRSEYIKFRIYCDRGTAEQIMRHEIGTDYDFNTYSYQDKMDMLIDVNPSNIIKNMQSFRYVDKTKFDYSMPNTIKNNDEAAKIYEDCMKNIDDCRTKIKELLIKDGVTEKKSVEDSNFVLPRATNLWLTIGFTPEALIHFMHKRLCTRAQDEIRKIAIEMKEEVKNILPEFAEQLVPHCNYLLWCPENNRTCGAYPTKDEFKNKYTSLKNNILNNVPLFDGEKTAISNIFNSVNN